MTNTFNPTAADFPNANIADCGNYVMINYPAYGYVHAANSEIHPLNADQGGDDLGKRTAGVAVPFPTRRYGMMHKHFGIGFYKGGDGGEAGQPFAYGKAVSISSGKSKWECLVAASIGGTILLNGKRYTVRQTANENIELDCVD